MRIKSLALLTVLLAFSSPLWSGDLQVSILNGTTNSTGVADKVTLLDLTSGMQELESVSGVQGTVIFKNLQSGNKNQYLIQAVFQDVSYSQMFVPTGDDLIWKSSVTVYNTGDKVSDLHATIPYYAVYAFEDRLYIQKRLVIENHSNPPVAFVQDPGIIKVHIPDNIIELDYLTFNSGAMPLQTQAIDTKDGKVLPNPVKPGTSEIDIAYYIPYNPNGTHMSETINYPIEHFHAYSKPTSLNLSAERLSREGTDTENGWAIYAIDGVNAGSSIDFHISGAGLTEAEAQQQNTGRIIVDHRLPTGTKLLLSGLFFVLIITALTVSIVKQSDNMKQESIDMLKQQKARLLDKYAAEQDTPENDTAKKQLLQQLQSVYKTLDRIK